jgi:hypothetical protein
MTTPTSATTVIDPVVALKYAISCFTHQADFVRALAAAAQKEVKSAHIANWLRRGHKGERGDGCGRGVSEEFAPHVEAITGVPCECLRPNVNWALVRNRPAPEIPAGLLELAEKH